MAEAQKFLSAEFPGNIHQNAEGGITVEQMLNEPTRISRYVTEKISDDLLSEYLYSSTKTSGGALIFNQLLGASSAASEQRTGVIAPGGEFPTIDNVDVEEQFVKVRKIGGKVGITDEAVKRNDSRYLNQELMRLANRMKLDLESDAIAAFDEAIDAIGDAALKFESTGWAAKTKVKAADKVAADSIEADLLKLRLETQKQDLGYNFSTLLINPEDHFNLSLVAGVGMEQEFVGRFGWTIKPTNRVEKGSAYLVAPKQVGVIGVESPVSTETWREAKFQESYTQTWATVAHAITDPLAIMKLEGLAV